MIKTTYYLLNLKYELVQRCFNFLDCCQAHLQKRVEVELILAQTGRVRLEDEEQSIRRCVASLLEYFRIDWKDFPHSCSKDTAFIRVCQTFSELGRKQARCETVLNHFILIGEKKLVFKWN